MITPPMIQSFAGLCPEVWPRPLVATIFQRGPKGGCIGAPSASFTLLCLPIGPGVKNCVMPYWGARAWGWRMTGTPVKIMLSILGEGRGHMTQGMAVKEMVEKAGHEVVCATLGTGANRTPPSYFVEAMKMPVTTIPTLEFSYKNNRK